MNNNESCPQGIHSLMEEIDILRDIQRNCCSWSRLWGSWVVEGEGDNGEKKGHL